MTERRILWWVVKRSACYCDRLGANRFAQKAGYKFARRVSAVEQAKKWGPTCRVVGIVRRVRLGDRSCDDGSGQGGEPCGKPATHRHKTFDNEAMYICAEHSCSQRCKPLEKPKGKGQAPPKRSANHG